MKWIGQHIWDLVSRFRDHTYFEESITLSTGKSITMDEYTSGTISVTKIQDSGTTFNDNDTSLMTAAAIADKIEAYGYSTAAGDITGVVLTDDDGGTISDTAGSADFTIAGGTGITTSGSSTTMTINGDTASTTAKGVVELATTAETTTGTDTGRVVTPDGLKDGYQGSTNVVTLGTITAGTWTGTSIATGYTDAKVTAVNAGDGIDVDTTTGSVTVTAETASATNPGVVELATTSEADTGTDTARAITAAGLKSHVDGRYFYQYISLLGNATVPADGDWMTCSTNGISNHTWNVNLAAGGTTVDSSTVTIPANSANSGIRIPYAGVLVGFSGIFRRTSNYQSAAGLVIGTPIWNDYATFSATLRAYDAADYSAGPDSNYNLRPNKAEDLTRSHSITAGDVIYPVVKDLSGSASTCQLSMTIVIKTPIV